MNANYSNTSMLDMIFERRNKSYGAYVLRRDYNKSLKQAILSILSVVTLFCFGNFIRENMHGKKIAKEGKIINVSLAEVNRAITPPAAPKPKPPVPQKVEALAIATDRNTEKKIVTNDKAPDDTIIANKDLANLESGVKSNPNGATGIGATDGKGTERIFEVAREVQPAPPTVLIIAEVMPEFPGGDKALMQFIARNVEYPQMERDNGIQGRVISSFTVNEDGSISDIQILRSPSNGFNREVNRVLKKMPAFKPGMQAGRPVKVRFNLPVAFTLRD